MMLVLEYPPVSDWFDVRQACGLPAHPKYDWFMLLFTILIELMPKKHEWTKELCDTDRNVVTFPRVAQSLANALSSSDVSGPLKSMLSDIATWA